MSWWPVPARTPIGIELDGGFIRAAQLVRNNDRLALDAAVTIRRRGSEGELQDADVRRLAEVLDRQGFFGTVITLALPARYQLMSVLELPPANSGAPLEQLARGELARMHRCEPQALEMACWNLPARRRGGEGADVMAAACRCEDADRLLDVFTAAQFQVQALDVMAWSMFRAHQPLLQSQGVAVLLNIAWDCSTIVLLHRGTAVYERTLAEAGLAPLHTRLSQELGMSGEQIEGLWQELAAATGVPNPGAPGLGTLALEQPPEPKSPNSSAPELVTPQSAASRQARAIIEAHFEAMLSEVMLSCSYVSQRYESVTFEQIMLSGLGANAPGLHHQIERLLEKAPQVTRPSDIAECPARLGPQADDPALMLAIGMALHAED